MARWAELVFHVLAHVRATAGLAPSAYDPAWIAFVERHRGPSSSRSLAEDSELLGRTAITHGALAELQLLAWLFEDASRAKACTSRTLDQLADADVDDIAVLHLLRAPERVVAAEILRAGAELEQETYEALPPPDREPLVLDAVIAIVPWLSRFAIETIRPLRIRGRVRGDRIFVGVPDRALGPSAEHVAFQAAHEATVSEVQRRARAARLSLSHGSLEHAALIVLRERSIALGEEAAHRRWISHFANIPELAEGARERLLRSDVTLRAIVEDLIQSVSARPYAGRS
jgi:hypothetical protein